VPVLRTSDSGSYRPPPSRAGLFTAGPSALTARAAVPAKSPNYGPIGLTLQENKKWPRPIPAVRSCEKFRSVARHYLRVGSEVTALVWQSLNPRGHPVFLESTPTLGSSSAEEGEAGAVNQSVLGTTTGRCGCSMKCGDMICTPYSLKTS
jgi:hypothetical protein